LTNVAAIGVETCSLILTRLDGVTLVDIRLTLRPCPPRRTLTGVAGVGGAAGAIVGTRCLVAKVDAAQGRGVDKVRQTSRTVAVGWVVVDVPSFILDDEP
jgi:hypothetical protein